MSHCAAGRASAARPDRDYAGARAGQPRPGPSDCGPPSQRRAVPHRIAPGAVGAGGEQQVEHRDIVVERRLVQWRAVRVDRHEGVGIGAGIERGDVAGRDRGDGLAKQRIADHRPVEQLDDGVPIRRTPMIFEYAGTADIRDGRYYTTRAGLTLYTYERDSDASVCYGACARQWRPYYVEGAGTGNADLTVHTRRDGRKQWAYRGKPVYTWHRDRNRGDLTGANRPGWNAVRLPPR